MKNLNIFIKLGLIWAVLFTFSSCDEDFKKVTPPAAVDFATEKADLEVSENFVYQVTVQSAAPASTARTFNLTVDPASTADPSTYTLPLTVTIPAGELTGYSELSFDYDALDFIPKKIILNFDEGDEILNNTRTKMTIDFVKKCSLNEVEIKLVLDNYPEETSWELYDLNVSTTVPIMSGGPYTGQTYATIIEKACLDTGNYALLLLDSYGDGISNGGYEIFVNGSSVATGTIAGTYAVGYFDIP